MSKQVDVCTQCMNGQGEGCTCRDYTGLRRVAWASVLLWLGGVVLAMRGCA